MVVASGFKSVPKVLLVDFFSKNTPRARDVDTSRASLPPGIPLSLHRAPNSGIETRLRSTRAQVVQKRVQVGEVATKMQAVARKRGAGVLIVHKYVS